MTLIFLNELHLHLCWWSVIRSAGPINIWNVIGFRLQVLKRPEYFGKFGKIHKVVINNSTSYAGSQVNITVFIRCKSKVIWHAWRTDVTCTWLSESLFKWLFLCVIVHSGSHPSYFPQGPSASAYVTYIRSEDALRAIQCVNNVVVDGRTLKVNFTWPKKNF